MVLCGCGLEQGFLRDDVQECRPGDARQPRRLAVPSSRQSYHRAGQQSSLLCSGGVATPTLPRRVHYEQRRAQSGGHRLLQRIRSRVVFVLSVGDASARGDRPLRPFLLLLLLLVGIAARQNGGRRGDEGEAVPSALVRGGGARVRLGVVCREVSLFVGVAAQALSGGGGGVGGGVGLGGSRPGGGRRRRGDGASRAAGVQEGESGCGFSPGVVPL